MSWPRVPLKHFTTLGPQYGANVKAVPISGYDVRYVRITDIDEFGQLRSESVVEPAGGIIEEYLLEEGDFLFARSGATVGKTYKYTRNDGPCLFAGYLIRFRANAELASPDFLRYYFQTQQYWAWVQSKKRVAAQPNINGAEYASLEIPLPVLREQLRIVELLDEADRLRRLCREADAKAARILPALFLKMFGDPATNPLAFPTERLDVLFDVFGGGTPSKSVAEYWQGDIPWVSPKDMKVDVIEDTEDYITNEAIENSSTKLVEPGSVLIVYRSGILAHTFPVAIAGRTLTLNQDLKSLNSKGEVLNEFLYGWLSAGQNLALSYVKKGATVHNIDGPRFLSQQVPKAPRNLQITFANKLNSLLLFKKDRENASEKIEALFSSLLQKAFSENLTEKWREANMKELLAEMEHQAHALNLPSPTELEVLS